MSEDRLLSSLYRAARARHPDRIAFHEDGRGISYAAFDEMVRRTAAWAADHGVEPGDRVAVWLVNRIEWLAWFFAMARVGATVVAVNTRYRSHELEYILNRSGARMLVMQAGFHRIDFPGILADVNADALPELASVVLLDAPADRPGSLLGRPVLAFDPESADPSHAPDHETADRPAVLFTTSGTTKGPKLVMHTAATLVQHTRRVASLFGLDQPGSVTLTALPLCGVFGLNSAFGALLGGAAIVLLDVFEAQAAADLMARYGATHLFASDEMIRRIAALAPGDKPFPALRLVAFAAFSSGASELAEALAKRGFPMRGLYGSSEVQALFSLQDEHMPLPDRALGGGTPASAEVRIRARDPETGKLCAHGQAGELEISSPTNFVGYLNNPEASAGALTGDGYFRTGDLGFTREDGSFVYLAGMGDAMRLGGFLVDPSEIEYAVSLQPGVDAVQVVAVEIEGQARPVAFVRPSGKIPDEAGMIAALRADLAAFKVPSRIWFVDEFPSTASANGVKIQRVKLREMAMQRLAAESGAMSGSRPAAHTPVTRSPITRSPIGS